MNLQEKIDAGVAIVAFELDGYRYVRAMGLCTWQRYDPNEKRWKTTYTASAVIRRKYRQFAKEQRLKALKNRERPPIVISEKEADALHDPLVYTVFPNASACPLSGAEQDALLAKLDTGKNKEPEQVSKTEKSTKRAKVTLEFLVEMDEQDLMLTEGMSMPAMEKYFAARIFDSATSFKHIGDDGVELESWGYGWHEENKS